MTAICRGPISSTLTRDADSHRSYAVRYRVEAEVNDGPLTILSATDLPQKGDTYVFGDEVDIWAFCQWDARVTRSVEDEKSRVWIVELQFTTKPPELDSCKDTQIEDPLLEPPKISGTFQKYTEEAYKDRFGNPVVTSSHEQISGPQNEWDFNRPSVKVEMNVGALQLDVICAAIDHVNLLPLWGFPARCIKLSNFSWERKFYGACYVYYTWSMEFDVKPDGWDRDLLDEGTKCLKGHWDTTTGLWVLDNVDNNGNAPDPRNPSHFIRFKDQHGNSAKVVLDGAGKPFNPDPNDYITGCTVCSRLPKKFSIRTESIADSLDTPIELTWVTGCQWTATHNGDLIALSIFSTGAEGAILQYAGWSAITWTGRISCFSGSGYLYPHPETNLDDGATMYPIAVFNVSTAPGRRHVEKYDDVDFIELGIPATF